MDALSIFVCHVATIHGLYRAYHIREYLGNKLLGYSFKLRVPTFSLWVLVVIKKQLPNKRLDGWCGARVCDAFIQLNILDDPYDVHPLGIWDQWFYTKPSDLTAKIFFENSGGLNLQPVFLKAQIHENITNHPRHHPVFRIPHPHPKKRSQATFRGEHNNLMAI